MQQQTRVSLWCERVIEGGWLLILALIPIYFNLLSARHFEPDKSTTLRSIVLVMLAAWLVRWLEEVSQRADQKPLFMPNAAGRSPTSNNLLENFFKFPLAIPVLIYSVVFIFATLTSITPSMSFWGSYQRLQGTYTNLSYIGIFLMMVTTLRHREQLERIVTVSLLTSVAVGGYGLIQHLELDPLPWKGDVVTRVASTMGNSIFVAAYLIMIVPLALYRFTNLLNETRKAPPSKDPTNDLSWALAYGLLVFGTLCLLLAAIKFGSVVRTVDFRYWWVYPGAIVVAAAQWLVITLQPDRSDQKISLWPGLLFLGYFFFLSISFLYGSSTEYQSVDATMKNGADWWQWLIGSGVAISIFYIAAFALRSQGKTGPPSNLSLGLQAGGIGLVLLIQITTIIFAQSRGPLLGGIISSFLFLTLVLLQTIGHLERSGAERRAKQLWLGLRVWLGICFLGAAFLLTFNLSHDPFFEQLRRIPYFGRFGSLFAAETGTGRVRTLIWAGDEHAGGAAALVFSNPLRTVIGWGPESMFVAYNPFYPPSLAYVESRGASPDRSHQAILDELVTKGFLGLVSYFFLLASFAVLCWRLLRQSSEWQWQIFFAACLSVVSSHFLEGFTGIPIVSTLTMLWVAMGMTIAGGLILERSTQEALAKDLAPVKVDPSTATNLKKEEGEVPSPQKVSQARSNRARRGRPSEAPVRGSSYSSSQRDSRIPAFAFYSLLTVLTVCAVWWFNLSSVYADMKYHEAEAYAQGSNLNEQVVALSSFLETLRNNPTEDFYYLGLGRTLMTIADQRRADKTPLGAEDPNPDLNQLMRLSDPQEVAVFVQSKSPLGLMSYAEAVLERARQLNPQNKDHYANLGRLNNFWYNWTQDLTRLQKSAQAYAFTTDIAPQDVALMGERARVLLMLGSKLASQGKQEEQYATAEKVLQRAHMLDPKYGDTDVQLGELYLVQGKLPEAVNLYSETIQLDAHRLDQYIERALAALEGQPDLLRKLRDAYAHAVETDQVGKDATKDALLYNILGMLSVRVGDMPKAVEAYQKAVALQPNEADSVRNYTLVLSDTRQYAEAFSQTQHLLNLLAKEKGKEQEAAAFSWLAEFFKSQLAPGGQ